MIGGMTKLQKHLRNTFLTGIFAAIPLAVTAFVVWYVESVTRQPLRDLLDINIPFLGVLIAIALIYVLGFVVGSIVGKWLLGLLDRLLLRVPLMKEVYRAWKQVTLTPGGKEGMFAKVVLVPVEGGRGRAVGLPGRGHNAEADRGRQVSAPMAGSSPILRCSALFRPIAGR